MRVNRNFLPSGDQERCWIKSPILETRTGSGPGSSPVARGCAKPAAVKAVAVSTAGKSQAPYRMIIRMIKLLQFLNLTMSAGAREPNFAAGRPQAQRL